MLTDHVDPMKRTSANEVKISCGASSQLTPTWDLAPDEWPAASCLDELCMDEAAARLYEHYLESKRNGRAFGLADYTVRYPSHAHTLQRLFQLHDAFDTAAFQEQFDSPDLPRVGDMFGPFQLIRELGRGGFARVFLAANTNADRKLFVLKISRNPSHESSVLNRLQHPNIMTALWSDTTPDGLLHVIGMPFYGGATLATTLSSLENLGVRPRTGLHWLEAFDRVCAREFPSGGIRSGNRELLAHCTFNQSVAWAIARIADGLDHAAQRKIIHCDLKPSNILITVGFEPMLLDFNLAAGATTSPESESIPTTIGGTPAYMSPERLKALNNHSWAHNTQALHQSDLFSLGLIMLQALVGSPPYSPSKRLLTAEELVGRLLEDQRLLLNSIRKYMLPTGLIAILERCLAPDPDHRYASSRILSEELDNWREIDNLRNNQNGLTHRSAWSNSPYEITRVHTSVGGINTAWRNAHSSNDRRHARQHQAFKSRDNPICTFRHSPGF